MKVIIIGAGIIGVTTAYYLNKYGYDVTVIERNTKCASECSHANGGQLSYSHAEPWANPTALRKIPRWLFVKDSPLVFHLNFDVNMWKWAFSFLMKCTNNKSKVTTADTLRLALYSKNCLHEIMDDAGFDFSYIDKGTVHVFRNEASLDLAIKHAQFQKTLGCDYEILKDRKACIEKEQAFENSPAFIEGGIYFPEDETGDVHKFTENLSNFLEKKGVKFLYATNVEKILTSKDQVTGVLTNKDQIEADNIIVAAGAASTSLLKKIDVKVPIYPMKGYSLSINIDDETQAPTAGVTDQYNKVVYSRLGNILRIAGTAEFAGYNQDIKDYGVRTIRKMVKQLFPKVGDIDAAKPWACLRPSTPEGTPIIGNTKYKNLYLNVGHGTLGWTLSCGSAKIVSNIIKNKDTKIDLNGLTMEKYK